MKMEYVDNSLTAKRDWERAQAQHHVVPDAGPGEDAVLLEDEHAPRVRPLDLAVVDGHGWGIAGIGHDLHLFYAAG